MFVETKTALDTSTNYRNWTVLQKPGNSLTTTARGGCLVQMHPNVKLGKANPPAINNFLNDCLHFTLPYMNDKIHIFLVYIHPHAKLENAIFVKAALYKYAIIIGDLNVNKKKNKQIQSFIINSNFIQANTGPTFLMENNADSTPDAVLYSKTLANVITDVYLTPDLCSDHLGIVFTLKLDSVTNINTQPILDLRKTDYTKVNKALTRFIDGKGGAELTIQDLNNFQNVLENTIIKNTPATQPSPYLYKLPKYIIHLIKTKRRLYRDYRENKNVQLKKQINSLNKNIQKMVFQFKINEWLNVCREIENDRGRTFWQKIKKVTKYKGSSTSQTISHGTNEETADIFAKLYEKSFSPSNHQKFDPHTYKEITDWYVTYFQQNPEDDQTSNDSISEEEYYETLAQTKNTAPGLDNITGNLMKNLDTHVHEFIIKLYNYCLRYNYFPVQWKHGLIIPIPKPKQDLLKPESYRPITLLSVLGKNLENIIKRRLAEHANGSIPPYQFGFKPQNSTVHPLYILVNNLQTAHNLQRKRSAALLLDISKAFDSVWHAGLLFKLHKLNTPKYLIHFLHSYLANRTLQVKFNDSKSIPFTPQQGLPQGSPLSPILYNIYCHDIYPESINLDRYVLQYADDTTLVVHKKKLEDTIIELQSLADKTMEWFYKWRLTPNPNKFQLLIPNLSTTINPPYIKIESQRIFPQSKIKYLGLTIDHKIKFHMHANNMKKECIKRAKRFRTLTYGKRGISTKTACKIYKSICRPLLEYGHITFTQITKKTLNTIETAERTALRSITKIRHPNNPLHNPSNSLLYKLTKIEPIQDRLDRLKRKFASKEGNWEILQNLCLDSAIPPNSRRTNLQHFYNKIRFENNVNTN